MVSTFLHVVQALSHQVIAVCVHERVWWYFRRAGRAECETECWLADSRTQDAQRHKIISCHEKSQFLNSIFKSTLKNAGLNTTQCLVRYGQTQLSSFFDPVVGLLPRRLCSKCSSTAGSKQPSCWICLYFTQHWGLHITQHLLACKKEELHKALVPALSFAKEFLNHTLN